MTRIESQTEDPTAPVPFAVVKDNTTPGSIYGRGWDAISDEDKWKIKGAGVVLIVGASVSCSNLGQSPSRAALTPEPTSTSIVIDSEDATSTPTRQAESTATRIPSVEDMARGGGYEISELSQEQRDNLEELHRRLYIVERDIDGDGEVDGTILSELGDNVTLFASDGLTPFVTGPEINEEFGEGTQTAFIASPEGPDAVLVVSVGGANTVLEETGAERTAQLLEVVSGNEIYAVDSQGNRVARVSPETNQWTAIGESATVAQTPASTVESNDTPTSEPTDTSEVITQETESGISVQEILAECDEVISMNSPLQGPVWLWEKGDDGVYRYNEYNLDLQNLQVPINIGLHPSETEWDGYDTPLLDINLNEEMGEETAERQLTVLMLRGVFYNWQSEDPESRSDMHFTDWLNGVDSGEIDVVLHDKLMMEENGEYTEEEIEINPLNGITFVFKEVEDAPRFAFGQTKNKGLYMRVDSGFILADLSSLNEGIPEETLRELYERFATITIANTFTYWTIPPEIRFLMEEGKHMTSEQTRIQRETQAFALAEPPYGQPSELEGLSNQELINFYTAEAPLHSTMQFRNE